MKFSDMRQKQQYCWAGYIRMQWDIFLRINSSIADSNLVLWIIASLFKIVNCFGYRAFPPMSFLADYVAHLAYNESRML